MVSAAAGRRTVDLESRRKQGEETRRQEEKREEKSFAQKNTDHKN